MKQIAFALAILSIVFSQNAVTAQGKTKKQTEECPQLTACKESWTNANNTCHTAACPQKEEKLKGCSKEDIAAINAYNLHCRNESRKITNTGKQK